MHRSIRHLLGLAAASAVIACGLPALASTAHAATTTTTTATTTARSDDLSADWGPVYSAYYGNGRAMARGRVWDNEDDGSFNFEARLYDRNSPARLCAYLQMRLDVDGVKDLHTAKKCGPVGYAPYRMGVWEEDIPDSIAVRVCYLDTVTRTVKLCGKWSYAYRKVG
ncbi:hypothetical protein [Microbispora sp. NPDC046933]|uniref:hypothetical protein n=1 Tax=Microbispora sp. NPDC046933 TaxID=3155618 RepID=UPI00340A6369